MSEDREIMGKSMEWEAPGGEKRSVWMGWSDHPDGDRVLHIEYSRAGEPTLRTNLSEGAVERTAYLMRVMLAEERERIAPGSGVDS